MPSIYTRSRVLLFPVFQKSSHAVHCAFFVFPVRDHRQAGPIHKGQTHHAHHTLGVDLRVLHLNIHAAFVLARFLNEMGDGT